MRITLCGSTRFEPLFHEWSAKLALAGHTVYSLSMFGREASDVGKEGKPIVSEKDKLVLDLVHLDKILNSDAVVVINQDGYVGDSTSREVIWARMQGKHVYWHFQNHPTEPYAGVLLGDRGDSRVSTRRNRDGQRADFSGFPARHNGLADVGLDLFPRYRSVDASEGVES